ncbi:hypothetical protein BDV96DRAFT_514751 [Lophiotrema nucula]|uniref:Zn(2)-C6 fungal-type domain-containing protein n=1 Tax=Lophiotrema nucula TaxID=690887 RepID=A0A6A5ZK55_9PLEO|nr:hypothetical protein BDV96DRAFT_514751 [Lophiotrema nucula]
MDFSKTGHQPEESRLLCLVDELLLAIIAQIDAHEALCNLAATCTRLQALAEPFAWASLLVISGRHARRIASALQTRPDRASYVKDFSVRYQYQVEEGIEELDGLVHQMSKLRQLHIESPCPNNDPWRNDLAEFTSWTRIDYQALFEQAMDVGRANPVLPMLQSFTLHGHSSQGKEFSFGRTAAIFLHPTVRRIAISCTNFEADDALSNLLKPENYRTTALQSLKFIECNVYISLLDVVLRLPKALKELCIGERLYVFDECRPVSDKPRTQHPRLLEVLQHQADSLERLVHIGGNIHYCMSPRLTIEDTNKLRNLTRLRHLEISFESVLSFCLARCDGPPDSLETIRFSDEALTSAQYDAYQRHVNNIMRYVCQLAVDNMSKPVNVDVCLTHNAITQAVPLRALPEVWGQSGHNDRKNVYKIASALKSRGARFRIFGQTFDSGRSYIPPYMYGEELPKEVLVYDSDNYWTFQGVNWRVTDDDRLLDQKSCVKCMEDNLVCDEPENPRGCLTCRRRNQLHCQYPPPSPKEAKSKVSSFIGGMN